MPLPPLVRHVRYAEQWLRWARADYQRGDVRGAVLRLMLAEAEIRHAREAGMHLADSPRIAPWGRRLTAAALGSAAALLLALGYPAFHGGQGSRQATMDFGHNTRAVPLVHGPLGPVQLESGNLLVLMPPSSGTPAEAAGPFGSWDSRAVRDGLPGDLSPFPDLGAPWSAGGRVTSATLRDQQTPGGSF